jgi:hypothetical protein
VNPLGSTRRPLHSAGIVRVAQQWPRGRTAVKPDVDADVRGLDRAPSHDTADRKRAAAPLVHRLRQLGCYVTRQITNEPPVHLRSERILVDRIVLLADNTTSTGMR